MKELKELQIENQILKAGVEAKGDADKIYSERIRLTKENKQLKYPARTKVLSGLKEYGKKAADNTKQVVNGFAVGLGKGNLLPNLASNISRTIKDWI